MATQSNPTIPPRPARSPLGTTNDMPLIPPRPSRRLERSVSPLRSSNYAPSPLNEPPNGSALSRTVSNDVPSRPPSVVIPSLGEEGIEYEDLDVNNTSDGSQLAPAETRNVASDLKLHAPRPSLPTSSAKAKVQAVTRTDSSEAAAAGYGTIGSSAQDEQPERSSRSIYPGQGSRATSSTTSFDRPRSIIDEEHGIPEIGQRVPMLAYAGDVQAPSPSPYLEQSTQQRPGRGHNRSRSGRESSLPPGSYGLHGHGVPSGDKFEKAWYDKHPDEFAREEKGQYGSGVGTPRPDWALSSDDLNKIVRGSAVTGSGLGTSPAVTGTPEEEVGYIASDQYSHRLASPPPESTYDSRPVVESPLHKSSIPAVEVQDQEKKKPSLIHIDEPYHHLHHPDGFAHTPDPEELAQRGNADESEDGPILAADEMRPESAYQHPAVSPTFSRRESMDYEGRSRTPSVNESRSNSRASRHDIVPTLARYNSRGEDIHAPLEDVEEYEPLFPEEESKENNPLSTADRFKQRPDTLKHRFPSEDIWEDSPNSLQLHATVSTPDIPKEDCFETPEQEAARKTQTPAIDSHQVAQRIINSGEEQVPIRPALPKQRFPSRDIWEDAPESQTLVTTIEPSDGQQVPSPDVASKPNLPRRPEKRQPPQVDASTKPASPVEKRQPPSIPERPKPQIPTRPTSRPSKDLGQESQDVSTKQKPAVPARPGGSKIASLKAGFLTDLNSRLQLGPHAPPKPQEKKEEAPAEKVPLSDARKGRARGPARRKPAVETPSPRLATIPEIKITETWNVWEVREDGNLIVGGGDKGAQVSTTKPEPSGWNDTMAPPLAENTAGEPVDPKTQPAKEDVLEPHSSETTPEAVQPEPEPVKQELPSAKPVTESLPSAVDLSAAVSGNTENVAERLSAATDGKRLSDS
ncbi:altered inheritance of mitochondria protein 21, partial [Aspergillus californicus]